MAIELPTDAQELAQLETRFWSKVDRSAGPNGCWPWIASRNDTGYGLFWLRPRVQRATRVVMALAGNPVPDGDLVCHRCDNPACVNLEHLFVGSYLDNSNDMIAKDRHWHVGIKANAKLKPGDPDRIKNRLRAGDHPTAIARDFGISRQRVYAFR